MEKLLGDPVQVGLNVFLRPVSDQRCYLSGGGNALAKHEKTTVLCSACYQIASCRRVYQRSLLREGFHPCPQRMTTLQICEVFQVP